MLASDPSKTPAAPAPASARVGATAFWRRGFARRLLYGNVDRAAKAKARVGLAILVFAIGYAVIAGRLVMFAAAISKLMTTDTSNSPTVTNDAGRPTSLRGPETKILIGRPSRCPGTCLPSRAAARRR